MPWFVSYDAVTGNLNREGDHPQPDESPAYVSVEVTPVPVRFDEVTGKPIAEWSPTARAYVSREDRSAQRKGRVVRSRVTANAETNQVLVDGVPVTAAPIVAARILADDAIVSALLARIAVTGNS